jgi:hypothetical protein
MDKESMTDRFNSSQADCETKLTTSSPPGHDPDTCGIWELCESCRAAALSDKQTNDQTTPGQSKPKATANCRSDQSALGEHLIVDLGEGPPLGFRVQRDGQKTRVTVCRDKDVVHIDTINPSSERARKAFIKTLLAKLPTCDPNSIDSVLLRLATTQEQAGTLPCDDEELDVSCIHRPELFHTDVISGLAVPSVRLIDGEPACRWVRYLRWADGTRECRPMAAHLAFPCGGRLWLHPTPAAPSIAAPSGWSSSARRAWLNGHPAPNPAMLFRDLSTAFADYLDFPLASAPGTAATLSLWVLLSFAYSAWPAVPYLYVGGPTSSGKSRVFDLLSRLVYRPLSSSNLTGPALFRTIHDRGGTLLFDEAERLRQATPDVQDLMSILLAGYKRGGRASRLEPFGESFRTIEFEVFGPKAVACIAGLPPTLANRCIQISMFRAGPESAKPKLRLDDDSSRWKRLRDDLHAVALEGGPVFLDLASRIDVCPIGISGRDFELWQPILSLASWVESFGAEGLLELMQNHALATLADNRDDAIPESDEILLEVIANKFRVHDRPTPNEILQAAKDRDPATFEKWIPATVTRRLKSYGIRTPKKTNGIRRFEVCLEELNRIQRSYGIDLGLNETDSAIPV